VFIEERNNVWNTPYLFNSKELDEETGLYYYGARYYNPRESVWLSVDKPLIDGTYMSGIHNGGVYNSFNLNGYAYCYQNPVRLIDPDGNQVDVIVDKGNWFKGDVGHTFISVGSGDNQTVYTYGRWAGTYPVLGVHGPLNNGPGVMIKLVGEDARAEIKNYISKYDAQVYRISNVDESIVKSYLDNQFISSSTLPNQKKYKDDTRAHVIDEYSIPSNTCTTKSEGALKAGLKGRDISYTENKPLNMRGGVVPNSERPVQGKVDLNSISPDGLNYEFTKATRDQNSGVSNITNQY
jgi:RHS repeat-associated protein